MRRPSAALTSAASRWILAISMPASQASDPTGGLFPDRRRDSRSVSPPAAEIFCAAMSGAGLAFLWFNAYPAEIEGYLMEHPAVAQAAVIGVPDDRMGQVGKAFVVCHGDPVGAEELIGWCRERMAGYKAPRYVEFLDELPLNATGKVMKDRLGV